MKLIKQTTLLFKRGRSEKIYEVDLCENGPDRFVVNFRYGRRGGSLKSGTRTTLPVRRARADELFNKLVNDKIRAGYTPEAGASSPSDAAQRSRSAPPARRNAPPPQRSRSESSRRRPHRRASAPTREAYLLDRLREGDTSHRGEWPFNRVIWKAGALRLQTAGPQLVRLLETEGRTNSLRDYCLAWAIGRCASGTPRAIEVLEARLSSDGKKRDHVRNMAAEAIRLLSVGEAREAFLQSARRQLAEPYRAMLQEEDAERLQKKIFDDLSSTKRRQGQALTALSKFYRIDDAITRPIVLTFLRETPLIPPHFQVVRQILKAAEYRCDGEVFGVIAYRVEKTPANNPSSIHRRAYQKNTRAYLRRRVARSLESIGESGDAASYVKMAVGVLLPFLDTDSTQSHATYRRNLRPSRVYIDTHAQFLAFYQVLYKNSPRYRRLPEIAQWICAHPYRPGEAAPALREEAFPEHWNAFPQGLLHLLMESGCERVHVFAVRALRERSAFLTKLRVAETVRLLRSTYSVTAEFGFELAKLRYRPHQPDVTLVQAVLTCNHAPGRREAFRWVETQRRFFIEDRAFTIDGLLSHYGDVRRFFQRLLKDTPMKPSTAQSFCGDLLSRLIQHDEDKDTNAQRLIEALKAAFDLQLRDVNLEQTLQLLGHPTRCIQAFAAELILTNHIDSDDLESSLIRGLLNSPYQEIRDVGVGMFETMSIEGLCQHIDLIGDLATHSSSMLRDRSRRLLCRLAEVSQPIATRLTQKLLSHLLTPGIGETAQREIIEMLQQDLLPHLDTLEPSMVIHLLQVKDPSMRDLGCALLQKSRASEWSVEALITLASNELLSAREVAWSFCEASTQRLQADVTTTLGLFNSAWRDTRAFAFELFRRFDPQHLPPSILIAICDNVREDVQQFGRELLTRCFRDEDGAEYMLKLSEHPNIDLQQFVTHYLDHYAATDTDRIRALTPYFIRVLSAVNRGNIARQRVFTFLHKIATQSEERADIVAGVLTRQSVTASVGDRARCIEIMLEIHEHFPNVSLPLSVHSSEVRHAV